MNRAIAILFAAVLASGCVGQGTDVFASLMTHDLSKPQDLVGISVEVPDYAFSGKDFKWWVKIEPKMGLENAMFNVYDRWQFIDGELCEPQEREDDEGGGGQQSWNEVLESGRYYTHCISYRAPEVGAETTVNVKVRFNYLSWQNMSQTLNVLTENEWFDRDRAGTLGELAVAEHKTSSDLKITMSWSESPPFVDGRDYHLYVDYEDTGTGVMEDMKTAESADKLGDIFLNYSSNLEFKDCDDYVAVKDKVNTLTLSNPKAFVDRRAKRSTCTFTAKAEEGKVLNTGTVYLSARYRYKLYSDFGVKIKP